MCYALLPIAKVLYLCEYRLILYPYYLHFNFHFVFKGRLSGLRQFLTTESSLKMMKNSFYFTSKALSVLKIFKFFSRFFGHVSKSLDQKEKVNFKFYNFIAWLTNNCATHIAQYLEK